MHRSHTDTHNYVHPHPHTPAAAAAADAASQMLLRQLRPLLVLGTQFVRAKRPLAAFENEESFGARTHSHEFDRTYCIHSL